MQINRSTALTTELVTNGADRCIQQLPDSPYLQVFRDFKPPSRTQRICRVAANIAAVPLAPAIGVAKTAARVPEPFDDDSCIPPMVVISSPLWVSPLLAYYLTIDAAISAAHNIRQAAKPAKDLERGSIRIRRDVAQDLWRILASMPRDQQTDARFRNFSDQIARLQQHKTGRLVIKAQ